MKTTKAELLASIDKLQRAKPKITIIGDVILDEYLIGYPERISREAPVLILEYKENYYRLGGAANAAINAAKLGAQVTLIGSVGLDNAAAEMQDICEKNNIIFKPLKSEDKLTTLKTRILSTNQSSSLTHAGTSSMQQVLRIDKQTRSSLTKQENADLLKIISGEAEQSDLFLLSDYSLGVLNESLVNEIMSLKIKTVVDPSSSFKRFQGAFLITPNEPDTEKELNEASLSSYGALDFSSKEKIAKVNSALKELMTDKTSFLVTRGAEGMILFENNQAKQIPAFNKAEVFDVTGAGDTVSACVSVAIAAGLSLFEAMLLGNLAASIVVRKSGAATTNINEMNHALNELEEISYESFDLVNVDRQN